MTLPAYTTNLKLAKPNFEDSPWHDDVNGNMDKIDSVVSAGIGISKLMGLWANATAYVVGDRTVDADGSIWEALVDHTSASTGDFLADRTLHPTYWEQINIGFIDFRGPWQPLTEYFVGDFVFNEVEHLAGLCIMGHTSSANQRNELSNWVLFFDLKDEILSTIANATAAATAASEAQVNKIEWKGQWTTGVVYELRDAVKQAGSSYICVIAHTAGVFATDLAATRWELLAQKGTDGAGAGDMPAAVYDPGGVEADAFAMDNMVEGSVTKIMTATERAKLAAIEAGAQVNPTAAATKIAYESNGNTNAFTDAEKSKLSTVNSSADQTNTITVGAAINTATTLATVAAEDQLAVFDASDSLMKKWGWTAFLAAIQTALSTVFSSVSHVHPFASITLTPTTAAGYGITNVSLVGHTHDDRYYTEGETNSLLAGRYPVTTGMELPIGTITYMRNANGFTLASGATTTAVGVNPNGSDYGNYGAWRNIGAHGVNPAEWGMFKRVG